MRPRLTLGLTAGLIVALAAACFATATERVAPPQDHEELYLSVVGDADSAEYKRLLHWFDTNEDLKSLKNATHFRPVTTRSAVYRERYADNVSGLPCIRLQEPNGIIIYETAGRGVPKSANALLNSIEWSTMQILPWRRKIERRECPNGECDPEPGIEYEAAPPVFFEEPEPPEPGVPAAAVILGLIGATVVGAGAGLVLSYRDETGQEA